VIDDTGKIVLKEKQTHSNKINISRLIPGLYVLRVVLKNKRETQIFI